MTILEIWRKGKRGENTGYVSEKVSYYMDYVQKQPRGCRSLNVLSSTFVSCTEYDVREILREKVQCLNKH